MNLMDPMDPSDFCRISDGTLRILGVTRAGGIFRSVSATVPLGIVKLGAPRARVGAGGGARGVRGTATSPMKPMGKQCFATLDDAFPKTL